MFDDDSNGTVNEKEHTDLMKSIWSEQEWGPNIIKVSKRDDFPSFTVVRHPIYRLVSAWLEKLGPMEPGHSEKDKSLNFVNLFKSSKFIKKKNFFIYLLLYRNFLENELSKWFDLKAMTRALN